MKANYQGTNEVNRENTQDTQRCTCPFGHWCIHKGVLRGYCMFKDPEDPAGGGKMKLIVRCSESCPENNHVRKITSLAVVTGKKDITGFFVDGIEMPAVRCAKCGKRLFHQVFDNGG